MTERLEQFFSPRLTLRWRGYGGKLPPGWYPDRTEDRRLLIQLMRDAGIDHRNGVRVSTEQLDAVDAAAGAHGYSTETIGWEKWEEEN